MSGYYSKKYDDRLQSLWLENYPQPILLRWPPLYLTMQCLKACWALPKLCTMRQSVYTRGHVAATHPWDMYPQHFHFCPNVAILSLLDVPTTRPCYLSPLHVPAACPFYTSLLHVLPACPFYTPLLHVPSTRPCYMSLLHVPAACPCYTLLLHVPSTRPCCTSLPHVTATCPTCLHGRYFVHTITLLGCKLINHAGCW